MKIAFTICSANYLPYAKSLADSLVQHNPDYTFVIALADTYTAFDNDFFAPHQVLPVHQMNLANFEEMCNRYNIFELSCAWKPYVAQYLFKANPGCDTVFYFDSDILLFGSLVQAETALQQHSLLLTPHLSSATLYEATITTELNVLRTGLYNAGFFGVRRGDECAAFLAWWKERLRYHCFNDAAHGLFVDQLWLNLAPVYFKSTLVFYNPAYNLAYWNFSERRLKNENEKFIVNEKDPLVFFHYSGFDIHKPDVISKYQNQYNFENVPEYQTLFQQYRTIVLENNRPDFFSIPPTLGVPMPPPEPESIPLPREKNFFKRKWKKMFKKK